MLPLPATSSGPRRLAFLFLCGVALTPSPWAAFAQANYQAIPMGERAIGMGGAFTALSDDESGAYYNPAGPAMTTMNSLSLTTNFYGLVFGHLDSPIGAGSRVEYSTLNLIPATSSSLFHLGSKEGDLPSRWVICLNVFAPGNFSQQQRTLFSDVDENPTNPTSFSLRTLLNQRHILAGPTLAVRLSPRWSAGVSVFGSIYTYDAEYSFAGGVNDNVEAGTATDLFGLTLAESGMHVGFVVSAGVRFNLSSAWSFGLSARSPSIPVMGSSTAYQHGFAYSATDGTPAVFVMSEDQLRTRFETPVKLAAGVAWTHPSRLTLSFDVNAHLPHRYETDPTTGLTQQLQFTPNVAVGVEKFLGQSIVLRAGAYTDLPNVASPTASLEYQPERITTFGGTLTGSWLLATTSTTVGFVGTFSTIESTGYDYAAQAPIIARGQQGRLYFIISSSFSY